MKFILTMILVYVWCILWTGLEYLIEGQITNRTVDNIMTIIVIPIIYFAVSNFINKKRSDNL